jgi:phage gp16-like protein
MDKAAAIKLIHVARRDLGIDNDAWRDLLRQKFRVESSKELGFFDLCKLVEHLKKCGFKVRHKTTGGARRPTSRPLAGAAQAKPGEAAKIRALWIFLHTDLGLVKDPSEKALVAYVKRITGCDALQWLDGQESYRVIETLKKWAERVFLERLNARVAALDDAVNAGCEFDDAAMQRTHALVAEARKRVGIAALSGKPGKPGAYDACLAAWKSLDAL